MVENSSVSFSDDELSVLKSALECFIKTKSIKGVSPQRKSSQDDIARSVLPRIFHLQPVFNANEVRVMLSALILYQLELQKMRNSPFSSDDHLSVLDDLIYFLTWNFVLPDCTDGMNKNKFSLNHVVEISIDQSG